MEQLADFFDTMHQLMELQLFMAGDSAVTIGGIVRAFAVLVVAWWVSKLGQRALQRVASSRPTMTAASVYTIGRLLHYTVLAIGVVAALSTLGIDLNKFALFASALGVGVGFGLQTVISNFVAGLLLLFDRTLKVGDFVDLESGVTGEVKEINIRSTTVTTNDNVDVVVPNSEFVNGRVTNWTMRDAVRRLKVPFGVSYSSDKEVVRKVILEAARAVEHTLEDALHPIQVWLINFGDSSLDFELVVWLKDEAVKKPGRVHADYLWAIHTALEQHDIEIPFPQRDLHVRSWSPPIPKNGPDAKE